MSTIETNKWYVVYSKPQKEDFAEVCLRRRGVEVFLPRLLFPEALGKRRRLVPLFPNYLFIWISDPEQYHCVIWTPGVKRIVSFNGVPAPVDDNVVTFLKQQASEAGIIGARSNLRVGQEVEITGGPFDGLVGIIEDPPDARGRVKVLMRLLSREIRVEVPLRFVNDCWVPCLPRTTEHPAREYRDECSELPGRAVSQSHECKSVVQGLPQSVSARIGSEAREIVA